MNLKKKQKRNMKKFIPIKNLIIGELYYVTGFQHPDNFSDKLKTKEDRVIQRKIKMSKEIEYLHLLEKILKEHIKMLQQGIDDIEFECPDHCDFRNGQIASFKFILESMKIAGVIKE